MRRSRLNYLLAHRFTFLLRRFPCARLGGRRSRRADEVARPQERFLDTRIGVTEAELVLPTSTVLPLGVITMANGSPPTGIGGRASWVAVLIGHPVDCN